MIFVASRGFIARLASCLGDEEYSKLQTLLAKNPQTGPVIQGCGGLRKGRDESDDLTSEQKRVFAPISPRGLGKRLGIGPKGRGAGYDERK